MESQLQWPCFPSPKSASIFSLKDRLTKGTGRLYTAIQYCVLNVLNECRSHGKTRSLAIAGRPCDCCIILKLAMIGNVFHQIWGRSVHRPFQNTYDAFSRCPLVNRRKTSVKALLDRQQVKSAAHIPISDQFGPRLWHWHQAPIVTPRLIGAIQNVSIYLSFWLGLSLGLKAPWPRRQGLGLGLKIHCCATELGKVKLL